MRYAPLVMLAVLLLCCAGHVGNVLKKSEKVVNSTNISGIDVFEMRIRAPNYTDLTVYTMRVEKIGGKVKIDFLNYTYNTTSGYQMLVHRKMKIALKNAWIIKEDGLFYVYTPNLLYMKRRVCVYRVAKGLPIYRGLPIITCLDVAEYFGKAKDVRVRDVGRYYLATYVLYYPYVRFADKARFEVWISKRDLIPVKAVITARYDGSDIRIVTEFKSYRTNVSGWIGFKGLKVIRRYP